jgi:hypothetical protein
VAEYLAGLEAEAGSPGESDGRNNGGDSSEDERQPGPDRKPPKVISPSDPSSANEYFGKNIYHPTQAFAHGKSDEYRKKGRLRKTAGLQPTCGTGRVKPASAL